MNDGKSGLLAAVVEIARTYPYLAGSTLLLTLAAVSLATAGRRWPIVAAGGVLAIPCAAWGLAFVPAYWAPRRIDSLPFGVEDVLFQCSCGCLAWRFALAAAPLAARSVDWRRAIVAGAAVTAVHVPTTLALWWAGMPLMAATVAAGAVVTLLLLGRRPEAIPGAFRSGLRFACVYGCAAAAILALFPAFRDAWNPAALSGASLLGLPVEEWAWGLAWGTCWSLFLGLCFAPARASTPPQPPPRAAPQPVAAAAPLLRTRGDR